MNKLKILPCAWYFFICVISWYLISLNSVISIIGLLLAFISIGNMMIFLEIFDINPVHTFESPLLSIALYQLINQLIIFLMVNVGAIKLIVKNRYSQNVSKTT